MNFIAMDYELRAHELREDIKVMLSLDSIGICKDTPGSQRLPFPYSLFYPDRGNFLAFIGNFPLRRYVVVQEATRGFKKGSSFPIEDGLNTLLFGAHVIGASGSFVGITITIYGSMKAIF